jgi:hypothetical protein
VVENHAAGVRLFCAKNPTAPGRYLVTLPLGMGHSSMVEWQILKPSENTAKTLGFVFADTELEARQTAFRKFGISDPKEQEAIVAIQAISDR